MNIIEGAIYAMLFYIVASNYYYAYSVYTLYSNMRTTKIENFGLQIHYIANNTNIFKIIHDKLEENNKLKVLEFKSLEDLRNLFLSDLDNYSNNKSYIIVTYIDGDNNKDVSDLFKEYNLSDIIKRYKDVNNIQIFYLKFFGTFYYMTKIY